MGQETAAGGVFGAWELAALKAAVVRKNRRDRYLGKNGSGAKLPPCGNLRSGLKPIRYAGRWLYKKLRAPTRWVQCVALAGRRTVNTEPLTVLAAKETTRPRALGEGRGRALRHLRCALPREAHQQMRDGLRE